MAEIFAFPAGDQTATMPGGDGAARPMPTRPRGVPDAMWHAVESVRAMPLVPGVRYREIPVPETLAEYGIGVDVAYVGDTVDRTAHTTDRVAGRDGAATDDDDGADARSGGGRLDAVGWIMILYSRAVCETWRSRWRCVAFARLALPPAEHDGLASDLYWDDLHTRLARIGAHEIAGTVTVARDTPFGALAGEPSAGCEMRVSWTPLEDSMNGVDAGAQVAVWARFVRSAVDHEEEPSVDR
ncbi:hypothetical protein DSM100688_0309 [Bifidobacterium ramosum]|uniref:DUF3000 family protein n=1 Tax=Bifidobacterium ramosum TaxID=1798158 RepID=A0A6L4X280_9BIFI|nr:DUF3000 family protein [Bifidobacterium ramosum]KAB8289229.1 hypothetical protein DSM100688_0309 [Bifidobacterium ramosum]NEG70935.1 DUF3000 family protein [Bifidobacterium ramosum]